MRFDVVLRVTTKLVLPFILVFGLYVHFHADFGPGGGFQGGVIAAGMVILYAIVFGVYAAKQLFPPGLAHAMGPLGVVIFSGAGVPALFFNQNYLNYSIYADKADKGQHYGVILVEVGVIVAVLGAMISIFYALVERGRS
ncbi:MAG: Na(+)/H(+) antiporter subunit B [Pseudomonadota bacterium]